MELVSINTARFIARISTAELNPRGLVVYPALIEGLAEKYNFAVIPDLKKGLDEEKGVIFEDGVWGEIAIDRVTIYSEAIVIDTRSSTSDSEALLNEALTWASSTYGLAYSPDMISRRFYVSEAIIRTTKSLRALNPKFKQFASNLSKAFATAVGIKAQHEVVGIALQYDISEVKYPTAMFKIERLDGSRFEDNKYYTVAPLPTEEHLRLLTEFEDILN